MGRNPGKSRGNPVSGHFFQKSAKVRVLGCFEGFTGVCPWVAFWQVFEAGIRVWAGLGAWIRVLPETWRQVLGGARIWSPAGLLAARRSSDLRQDPEIWHLLELGSEVRIRRSGTCRRPVGDLSETCHLLASISRRKLATHLPWTLSRHGCYVASSD